MLRRPVSGPLGLSLLSLALGGCKANEALTQRLLRPPAEWLVEPAQLGLAAEDFEIDVGGAELSGWLIRSPRAEGRTVVLFHDGSCNTSMLHPYYRFLVDAGLNVCVCDPRGFGRSSGEPSLWAAFCDLRPLIDWLRERPGVDPRRIGFYGLSLGSAMALFAAAEFGGCQALVVEDTPSLRDQIRAQVAEDTGSVGTTLGAGALEFVSLPDRAEPSESAPQLRVPSLWIAGAEQPTATLQGTLRAYYEMGGDKQLWVLPGTGAPPHSLLTHDGEYQRAVAQFLCAALGGAPERVDVRWRQLGGRTDAGLWEVTLDRRNAGDAAVPWAVQVCALDRDAGATWQNVWVQGSQQTLRLELTREPGVVGAMRIAEVERTEAGAWKPPGSPLSRAGRWYEEQQELLAKVRGDAAELPQVKAVAAAIQAREDVEQLPPQLDAELADVYWALGRVLTQSTDAEDKARGLGWLRRASAAQPEHPERHFWPGRQPTWGFRHARAVQAARERLVQIEGGTQAPGR